MEIDGNTINIGTKTDSPAHKHAVARVVAILSAFAVFILPASANMSTSMIEVAAMIDAMAVIWVSLTDMIIALVPLMLVMALIGFILGIFALILGKLKQKGLGT